MGFYTQMYHWMKISAQVGRSMDVLLDVTKNASVVEPLDEAWVLNAVLERSKPNFNYNRDRVLN